MSEPDGRSLAPLDPAHGGTRGGRGDREGAIDEAPEELRRLIVFQACDEWFAVPIESVREVHPLERVTRVPNAPAEVLGILNLRGRVLSLFDLAGTLGIPPGEQPNTHAIVLEFGDPDLHVALAAQRIAQARRVAAMVIEPPPREGALEGVFELDGQVVGLLEVTRVFARALPEWGVKVEGQTTG